MGVSSTPPSPMVPSKMYFPEKGWNLVFLWRIMLSYFVYFPKFSMIEDTKIFFFIFNHFHRFFGFFEISFWQRKIRAKEYYAFIQYWANKLNILLEISTGYKRKKTRHVSLETVTGYKGEKTKRITGNIDRFQKKENKKTKHDWTRLPLKFCQLWLRIRSAIFGLNIIFGSLLIS